MFNDERIRDRLSGPSSSKSNGIGSTLAGRLPLMPPAFKFPLINSDAALCLNLLFENSFTAWYEEKKK